MCPWSLPVGASPLIDNSKSESLHSSYCRSHNTNGDHIRVANGFLYFHLSSTQVHLSTSIFCLCFSSGSQLDGNLFIHSQSGPYAEILLDSLPPRPLKIHKDLPLISFHFSLTCSSADFSEAPAHIRREQTPSLLHNHLSLLFLYLIHLWHIKEILILAMFPGQIIMAIVWNWTRSSLGLLTLMWSFMADLPYGHDSVLPYVQHHAATALLQLINAWLPQLCFRYHCTWPFQSYQARVYPKFCSLCPRHFSSQFLLINISISAPNQPNPTRRPLQLFLFGFLYSSNINYFTPGDIAFTCLGCKFWRTFARHF